MPFSPHLNTHLCAITYTRVLYNQDTRYYLFTHFYLNDCFFKFPYDPVAHVHCGIFPTDSLSRSETLESHRIIKLSSSMFHPHCRRPAHLSASVNQEEHNVLPSNWVHRCISGFFKSSGSNAACSMLSIGNS